MRKCNLWFSWKGRRSTDVGLKLLTMPEIPLPARAGKSEEAVGRNGSIWIDNGAYRSVKFKLTFFCHDQLAARDFVRGWITSGDGWHPLILSRYPDRTFDARVNGMTENWTRLGWKETVEFELQPLAHMNDAQTYALSYSTPITTTPTPPPTVELFNPGNVESYPLIKVTGRGRLTLTLGEQVIELYLTKSGDTGIILDSDPDTMDAFAPDGSALLNDRMHGDFFTIPVGESTLTVTLTAAETGEASTRFSGIEIEPRWRLL